MDASECCKLASVAISEISLDDLANRELKSVCQALTSGSESISGKQGDFLSISKALDEEYFQLRERDEMNPLWLVRFHEARLAYALSVLASGLTRMSATEFLYELSHVHDDPSHYLDRVSCRLGIR